MRMGELTSLILMPNSQGMGQLRGAKEALVGERDSAYNFVNKQCEGSCRMMGPMAELL